MAKKIFIPLENLNYKLTRVRNHKFLTGFIFLIFLVIFGFFFFFKTGTAQAITVSGYACDGEGTTATDCTWTNKWAKCDGTTQNISLVVNGGAASTTACNPSTGAYSFTSVTIAAGNPVSVFFNTNGGNTTDKGVAVTVAADATSDIILTPRKNRVWIKTEGAVASITNTDLNHCDSDSPTQCANIPYSVDSSNSLTVTGAKIVIEAGKTFAPGGGVTTPAMRVIGTFSGGGGGGVSFSAAGTDSDCKKAAGVVRPLCVDDGGIFIPPDNATVTFGGDGDTNIQANTSTYPYYNLLIYVIWSADSDRNYTTTGDIYVSNNFEVKNISAKNKALIFNLGGDLHVIGTTTLLRSGFAGASKLITNNYNLYTGSLALGPGPGGGTEGVLEVKGPVLSCTGNVTISSGGILNIIEPSNKFYIGGNFNNAGQFNPGNGEVIFQDSTKTSTISGSSTFYNLTSTTGGKTLIFPAGLTQTIASGGRLKLNGSNWCSLLKLRSSSEGTQWSIDVQDGATADISFIDIEDSNAVNYLEAKYSKDSLNNSNWGITPFTEDDDIYNLRGWAWSENIGWISLSSKNCDTDLDCVSEGGGNCPPAGTPMNYYGVYLPRYDSGDGIASDPTDGKRYFQGYAWSENIGWIKFDPVIAWSVSGCGSESAYLLFNEEVNGLIRACAGAADVANCSGDANPAAGGWDGLICLRGPITTDGFYEVDLDTTSSSPTFNQFFGWAWGGGGTSTNGTNAVVGWISFNCKNTVCRDPNTWEVLDYSCLDNSCINNGGLCDRNACLTCSEKSAAGRTILCDTEGAACGIAGVCTKNDYKVIYEPKNTKPEKPSDLQESCNYCNISGINIPPAAGKVSFTWTYKDADKDRQSKYEIQVKRTDETFFVDCSEENAISQSVSSGGKGSSAVLIVRDSDLTGSVLCDNLQNKLGDIPYNANFYWRVRVTDEGGAQSEWSDWKFFDVDSHPHPQVNLEQTEPVMPFKWTPFYPAVYEKVQFCSIQETDRCLQYISFYDTGATSCQVDPSNSSCLYSWKFNDATSPLDSTPPAEISGSTPEYQNPRDIQFQSSGEKEVSLKVTDSGGFSCTFYQTVSMELPLPQWKEVPPTF